jgi:hypothetical protein
MLKRVPITAVTVERRLRWRARIVLALECVLASDAVAVSQTLQPVEKGMSW